MASAEVDSESVANAKQAGRVILERQEPRLLGTPAWDAHMQRGRGQTGTHRCHRVLGACLKALCVELWNFGRSSRTLAANA
ncbi:alanine-tRNA ligase [Babesia caballi]|uniref:Alanine-tRNA ligase n=1 Tax=Babesia caballi TaxID=5871 RepID=A0AAV4M207_BABCB|nr:alanine-tRNA ligase [Babesia caballi]